MMKFNNNSPQLVNLLNVWSFENLNINKIFEWKGCDASAVGWGSNISSTSNWRRNQRGVDLLKFSASQYFTVLNSSTLQYSGSISISWWCMLHNTPPVNFTILSCGANGETSAANQLYYISIANVGGNFRLNALHENGAGVNNNTNASTNLSTFRLYHFAITRDVINKKYNFYIDGFLDSSVSYTNNPDGGSTGIVTIGGDYNGNLTTNAWIGDLRIYNGILSPQSIFQIFSNPKDLYETHKIFKHIPPVLNQSYEHTLDFSQSFEIKIAHINLIDDLDLVQSTSILKISHLDIIQSLILTQEMLFTTIIEQMVIFTQSNQVNKIHDLEINQSLNLNQFFTRSGVFNLDIEQTITFFHDRFDNISNIPITIHEVSIFKKRDNFILSCPQQLVVLPNPLFGDAENATGEPIIKRTIWGDRYVYKKSSKTRRLQYTFTVDTQKRIEVEKFLIEHSHQLIEIENHKGEKWRGYIVNNPFGFDSRGRYLKRREKFDFVLEFEGVKI